MSMNYNPSALDSNKTLLQEMKRIENYLHDNPIYKVYYADTAYVAGTSQYDITDIEGDITAFGEGDVVLFNNTYYALVSSAGSEYFSIIGATSFKGDAGAQGPAGPAGPAGADGAQGPAGPTALEINTVWHITSSFNPNVEHTYSVLFGYFNRTPQVDDGVEFWLSDVDDNLYNGVGRITAVSSTTATVYLGADHMVKVNGDKGADGVDALSYGIPISFVKGSSTTQILTNTLYKQHFNRDPKKNDTFIARLVDESDPSQFLSYIASCEVQNVNESGNVTQTIASDILLITGINGTDGTDGTNGVDALTIGDMLQDTVAPSTSSTYYTTYTAHDFNRMPVQDDTFIAVFEDTVTNKSYICIGVIHNVDPSQNPNNPTISYQFRNIVETTGATGSVSSVTASLIDSESATNGQVLTADGSGGASWQNASGGTSLSKYTFDITSTSTSNISKLIDIIDNAKGRVSIMGYFSNATGRAIPLFASSVDNSFIRIAGFETTSGSDDGFLFTIKVGRTSQTIQAVACNKISALDMSISIVTSSISEIIVNYWNDTQLH